ncbi:MAG: sensor histidine kinase [Christensenellales bacterium]|jgi:two-component system phosphate regulon sensor histidine kinase PhoR
MKRRVFLSTLLAALFSVTLFGIALTVILFDFYAEREMRDIESRLSVLAVAMNRAPDGEALLVDIDESGEQARVTWISTSGEVRFDSALDPSGMENHLSREEIVEALAGSTGESVRHSESLGERTVYSAVRLADGSVLRLSETQRNIYGVLYSLLWLFALAAVAIWAITAVLARLVTIRIVDPINRLNLDRPLDNIVYEEFTPLLRRMAQQQAQLRENTRDLSAQQSEFRAVTDNMSEGLILINPRGEVVFINRGAERLFDASGAHGKHIYTLNHSMEFTGAVESALAGDSVSDAMAIGTRQYQVLASPVKDAGAVILLSDITDRYMAEQSRREFTANVSHELKTPLTNILGYAEVMENGLAPDEKLREFSGCIREEAKRLIQLVEDILRLSALDEGKGGLPHAEVSLKELVQDIIKRVAPQAEAMGVQIELRGEDARIYGDGQLADDLLLNIIENAVKYNRAGGRVEIVIGEQSVVVKDTGIGIDAKYHQRVFDRFFRVDKSRSHRVVGTGLGLAIVKHAAAQLGAKVTLKSEPGVGTEISVRFEG